MLQLVRKRGDFLDRGSQVFRAAGLFAGGGGGLARRRARLFGGGGDLTRGGCCLHGAGKDALGALGDCLAGSLKNRMSSSSVINEMMMARLVCTSISSVAMTCSKSRRNDAIWSMIPKTVSLMRPTLSEASRAKLRMSLDTTEKPRPASPAPRRFHRAADREHARLHSHQGDLVNDSLNPATHPVQANDDSQARLGGLKPRGYPGHEFFDGGPHLGQRTLRGADTICGRRRVVLG
jgi:hypothetical protein